MDKQQFVAKAEYESTKHDSHKGSKRTYLKPFLFVLNEDVG
jgi:hypothetical protein